VLAAILAVVVAATLLWIVRHAPRYRAFALAATFVAAGFWVVLAIGFRLHDQRAPGGLDEGLIPALTALIITTTLGLRALWLNRSKATPSIQIPTLTRKPSVEMAERLAWIERMKLDPRRRRYAEMIETGDSFWSPDRVEYDLDAEATTCCAHLAPIESAMRHAGINVRLSMPGTVDAACAIDSARLSREFNLTDSVKYEELVVYDRSLEDPPQARLTCSACNSRIWVVHPSQADVHTAVFPAG
jgi:hypothetical protein